MKNLKFTIIAVLIFSFAVIAEAQTKFTAGTNNAPYFNWLSPLDFSAENNRCSDVTTILTGAEIDEIVKIHNRVRHEVGTAPLKWNCDLARFSQNWANADTYEHSTEQQRGQIIQGGIAGENLAIDSGSTALMSDLNKGWIDEKLFWNNSTNECAPDKVCGHYTQMVWKTTTEIGCGIIRQSKKLGDEFRSSYLVCAYYPGGNTSGEKPY